MSLLHERSCDCLKSELELFNVPPTQTSIESGFFSKYYPVTTLDRGGPIEFKITVDSEHYVDPAHIFLYTKSRILAQDGSPIPGEIEVSGAKAFNDDAVVFPINYFHASRYKNVEIFLNNKMINQSDNLYPYKAFFECLLSHGADSKRNQLKMGLFSKDTMAMDNNFSDFDKPVANVNKETHNMGARWRYETSKFSRMFEMFGRIHSELFSQGKLLPGNSTIRIRLHRADPSFSLMAKSASKKYAIAIESAILYVRREKISASVLEAHQLALQKGRFKYPMRRIEMKFFTKGAGRQDISENNLLEGVLPRKVIIGLVKSEGFHGSYQSSPFNFAHFNVSQMTLRVNGQALPYDSLEMNYSKKHYLQAYFSMLMASNKLFRDNDLDICPEKDFPNGYAIYGFDLTPDLSNDCHFQLVHEGKLSLEIKLDHSSTSSITVVCYFEYDSILSIDSDGTVYYNE